MYEFKRLKTLLVDFGRKRQVIMSVRPIKFLPEFQSNGITRMMKAFISNEF